MGKFRRFNCKPIDFRIDKYANHVFYKSELHSNLKELNVSELFITGCVTDLCVESTIQSALTKGYNITAGEDGHTTGKRPHLKAEQVIQSLEKYDPNKWIN